MEPAYVGTSFLQHGRKPVGSCADFDGTFQNVLEAGFGHMPWMPDAPSQVVDPASLNSEQGMYGFGNHGDSAAWWYMHSSMQADAPGTGRWPVNDSWLWQSPQDTELFPSMCSLPGPPPGLEHALLGSRDDLDLNLEEDCECAALSVALAALPKEGEHLERSHSGASTACTNSSFAEDLACRTEGREPPPQVQMLVCFECPDSGMATVIWTVDAKKLRGSDKVAVSPPFQVACAPGTFKMMLCPRTVSDRKGGASFKKAKGRGYVQVKCEAGGNSHTLGMASMNISVGPGRADSKWQSPLKEPVHHNFEDCGVCSLQSKADISAPDSADKDDWNFLAAVDDASQTFAVRLDLQSVRALP
eukprot:TRINITY_DN87254_c0_g1_i1.p1 TRINITY_DN87254_c0_g1~~TRINITY_DN87254_c0_g1_i1.p1  ORF type:complete len:359 (+),score=68.02 TRINITY_DN87254_c0_g1_i1:85-1161(+)